MTIRVGVTGHRPHQLAQGATGPLEAGVRKLLLDIRQIALELHAKDADIFAPAEPQLRLYTALAEGADRIAAAAALEAGYELACALPFASEEYAKDFHDEASREEFSRYLERARTVFELEGRRSAEPQSYQAASLAMLNHSDVIIAVWDGKPSNGLGGTADTIEHAIKSGLPVLWFDEAGSGPRLLYDGLASKESELHALLASAKPMLTEHLREVLDERLAPPSAAGDEVESEARQRLKRFLSERERRSNFWVAYPVLLRLLGGRRLRLSDFLPAPYLAGAESEWSDYWALAGRMQGGEDSTCLKTVVTPRYAWADKLSVYFAQVYRSSYVANFVLGAAAVFLALLGVFGSLHHDKPFFVSAELLIILAILFIASWGGRQQWHERWLDYRQLAEQLRHMRMLIFTNLPLFEPSESHLSGSAEPGQLWIDWYARATARQLWPPTARVDAQYVRTALDIIGTIEVERQRDWHKRNAVVMEHVAHRLHAAGTVSFVLTGMVGALYLLSHPLIAALAGTPAFAWAGSEDVGEFIAQMTTFACAVLPAVGAAISGIRVQADFDDVSQRSHGMARHLDEVLRSIREQSAPDYEFLSRLAETVIDTMLVEIADWRFVFRGKSLALPA